SAHWLPVDFTLEDGRVHLERDEAFASETASALPPTGRAVFIRDESTGTVYGGSPAATTDASVTTGRIIIESQSPAAAILSLQQLPVEQIDELSVSFGPWSVSQHDPTAWPSHYADHLTEKEDIPAELFLTIDPLVSISTAIASRAWIRSLVMAAVILVICILIPRGFCGYLCPLGTLIDVFDWLVSSRIRRFRVSGNGWWVHLKYYILVTVLTAAVGGVLLSGYVSAIPVITRGLQFSVAPLQNGSFNGWHQMPPFHTGHWLSLALFAAVLLTGLLRPRFWCSYLCPSGAMFSLGNLFRISERKVESSCIHCNKCVEICPFDAIRADFTTRTADCTLCQTCGGVCPTHAIKFVGRWEFQDLKLPNDPSVNETRLGRRGFLSSTVGATTSAAAGTVAALSLTPPSPAAVEPITAATAPLVPVRPPGSVPENRFLQMCIRCGECFKACPSDVLQPLDFRFGVSGLWTPHVVADWSGCASSCNGCGQVCPTGAIRPLPLEEKRVARMGLAIINQQTCLPLAGMEACQLCVDECTAAGYDAIEFTRVGTEVDAQGIPVEGSGFLAPVMVPDKCVGCGLCQTRCHAINVVRNGSLSESAIVIHAGGDREDRLMDGSYVALREQERASRNAPEASEGTYLPDFLK
ncbi:MAG: 4Fe-4S binding protein, partial [Planctomycetaceae bacterium]|nr:4Fe-4S binding protein [Planctomycetaceae bacterium]